MDRLRVWISRLLAPLAFVAAAAALVFVVQQALDDEGSSTPTTPEPAVSVVVTTEEVETSTVPVEKKYYRVKPGDTLTDIAGRFGTTVDELLELNPGVDPLALEPGQRIRVE